MAQQVKIVDEAGEHIAAVGSDKKLKVSAEITGSTTSTAPGENVPAASEVIAGQSPTGKVRNVLVTEEGKLKLDVGEVTATIGEIEGKAAEGAAVSGKPVLIGGRYDSTPRSIDDGDVGAVAVNDKGQLEVEVIGSLASVAPGSPVPSEAVQVGGSDGTNLRAIKTLSDGTVMTTARYDAVMRAIDTILDTLGAENVKMFLPMWEQSGSTMRDLLRPNDLSFTVNGATLGRSGLLGFCPEFDGTNDYIQQDPIPDLSAATSTATQELRAPTAVAAQKLKVAAGNLGFVRLRLIKKGSPDGNVKVEIRTGAKDGTVLTNGTSETLACSSVGTSAAWKGLNFVTAPKMSKGTTYWIALVYDGNTNADADNNIGWRYDGAGGYGRGRHYFDGTSWTDTAGEDHAFDVFNNALTLPDDFVFILPALASHSDVSYRFLMSMSSAGYQIPAMRYHESGYIGASGGTGTPISASYYGWPLNAFDVWAMAWSKTLDTAKLKLYLNTALAASADGAAATAHVAAVQPLTIGAGISTGGSLGYYFKGRMGPAIMCSKLPTDANLGIVSHAMLALRKLGADV